MGYMPPESQKFSLKDISCHLALCRVLNLAERYQILTLVKEIKLILQSLPVTAENMMFTATTAKNFAVFEKVSKMLLEKCSKISHRQTENKNKGMGDIEIKRGKEIKVNLVHKRPH